MSQLLISIYQILATVLIMGVFIMFWTKTVIVAELLTVEYKLDRILNQQEHMAEVQNCKESKCTEHKHIIKKKLKKFKYMNNIKLEDITNTNETKDMNEI
ncbi:MAG: hypothetical protein J7L15_02430 [Clostridiales bacterium]|nr:hypothetical protein [Clostridiales bacterium]